MLSLEKCKKILVDNTEKYTDEEIKMIREHLYKIAEISYQKNKNEKYVYNKK